MGRYFMGPRIWVFAGVVMLEQTSALSMAQRSPLRSKHCLRMEMPGICDMRRAFVTGLIGLPLVALSKDPARAFELPFIGTVGEPPRPQFGQLPDSEPIRESGVRFIDYKLGTGPTPEYGQIIRYEWVGYARKKQGDVLVQFDNSLPRGGVLFDKHGSGRLIQGLDIALHTMRTGGERRIFIPRLLGYNDALRSFGPVPPEPINWMKLDRIKKEMDESGEYVFDIRVLEIYDDDADPGYYKDSEFPPEISKQVDSTLESMRQAMLAAA